MGRLWRMYTSCGALGIAVSLAGCGSDAPTESGDELTAAEFSDLAEVLATLGDQGLVRILPPAPAGPALHVYTLLPITVSCPLGGTVSFGGEVDENDLTGAHVLDFTLTYEACSAAASSGRTFALGGNLSYDLFFEIISSDVTTFELAQVGGLSWSTEGKSGSCQVDIGVVATVNVLAESTTATVSGLLCGRTVSETVQF